MSENRETKEESKEDKKARLLQEREIITKNAESVYVNSKEFRDLNNFISPLIGPQPLIEELIFIEDDYERAISNIVCLNNIYNILSSLDNKEDPRLKDKLVKLMNFVRDLTILSFTIKYSCSFEEAEARLRAINHYEEIINNNPKYQTLFNEMKDYFENQLKERKLNKGNLAVKKEHFFHDETNPTDDGQSFHVVFQINKNCNFKCTYCYEGLDKVTEILKLEDIPDIVRGLKEFQQHLENQNKNLPVNEQQPSALSFSILGGEPTIVNPEITQTLTKLLEEELDLKYIILITNNFDADKTINFFHPTFPKSKIKIQVSYDGGAIQDQYRLTSAKKSSRELVVQETRKLLNQGIRVTMKATLPPEAMAKVPDAVRDYLELEEEININNGQGQNFSYYPTMDSTSFLMTQLRLNIASGREDEKIALFNDVHETFKILLKLELDRLLDGNNAFTRWFRELSFTANETRCSAGVSLFGLDQDGEARYCHRTEYDSKSPFKNFKDLEYGRVQDYSNNQNSFITKFESTKEKILSIDEDKLKELSHCSNCHTLTCVKCPMLNINPNRTIDTTSTGNLFLDLQSHSINLTCELNNTISIYLYMYSKIIKI